MAYDVYQYKTKPQYRLVMPQGNPLPEDAGPAEGWKHATTLTESQFSAEGTEVAASMEDKGYWLYKITVKFEEIIKGPE